MTVHLAVLVMLAASPVGAATVRHVAAGGNLQAALDAAQPGDEVVLEAGATFTGSFKLPKKPPGPVITVRTSASLPARRIGPADAALMPKIASGSAAPALEGNGARNWKFDGIQFLPNARGLYNVIYTHAGADNITFDRVLIVGGPDGQKNAIAANGSHIVLSRSHIANIYEKGSESHGFVAWDGPGPFTIRDNYIEAASINILFGGANSSSPAHLPADIVVENNHLTKRLEWRNTGRGVKNLFELKSAKRVTVRNNLMENNWADAQNGYAVLFTTRNDDGGSPWAVVQDVVFVNNVVRGTEHGVNLLGVNDGDPSAQATNIAIRHNLFICTGNFLMAGGEMGEVIIEHNTIRNSGTMLMILYKGRIWPAGGSPRAAEYAIRSLTFRNNLAYHNQYGVFGDEGAGLGATALNNLTRQQTWSHNVLANRQGPASYPGTNWYPSRSEHEAQFNADYTLVAGSKYRRAGSDGQDLGRLAAATEGGQSNFPFPFCLSPFMLCFSAATWTSIVGRASHVGEGAESAVGGTLGLTEAPACLALCNVAESEGCLGRCRCRIRPPSLRQLVDGCQ